jgi:hypothetical protein
VTIHLLIADISYVLGKICIKASLKYCRGTNEIKNLNKLEYKYRCHTYAKASFVP